MKEQNKRKNLWPWRVSETISKSVITLPASGIEYPVKIFKSEGYPKEPWNFVFDTVCKQFDTISIFDWWLLQVYHPDSLWPISLVFLLSSNCSLKKKESKKERK